MNYHQTPEDIIKSASPEQRLLWNFIFLNFGVNISISQFFYIGGIAGSELTTYNANKLYLAYDLTISSGSSERPEVQQIIFIMTVQTLRILRLPIHLQRGTQPPR